MQTHSGSIQDQLSHSWEILHVENDVRASPEWGFKKIFVLHIFYIISKHLN